jgi:hypothetical protein
MSDYLHPFFYNNYLHPCIGYASALRASVCLLSSWRIPASVAKLAQPLSTSQVSRGLRERCGVRVQRVKLHSRQPRAPHRPLPIQNHSTSEQAAAAASTQARTQFGGWRQCNAPRSSARSSGPLSSPRLPSPRGAAAASVEAFA